MRPSLKPLLKVLTAALLANLATSAIASELFRGIIKSISADKVVVTDRDGKDWQFRLAKDGKFDPGLKPGVEILVTYEKSGGELKASRIRVHKKGGSKGDKSPSPPAPSGEPAGAEEFSPPPDSGEVAAESMKYVVLKVFYGTDRESSVAPVRGWLTYARMFSFTAIGLVVTLLIAQRNYLKTRQPFKWFVAIPLVFTFVLGVWETSACLQTLRDESKPGEWYGNQRDKHAFHYGTCEVSVPIDHRMGELESPSVLKLEFQEDPAKHVILRRVEEEPADTFFAGLRASVNKSPRKEALVFVHGYNVTFADAARRTAQMAYDLNFEGAPIFYSWPSQGGFLPYEEDQTNVAWTVPHLKSFLSDIASRSGTGSLHLIAHSMGNRALTGALKSLAVERNKGLPVLNEIVLTAPDIDADIFKSQIVPAIKGVGRRITLYASSTDWALSASKRLHGYARAGESGSGLVVCKGVDTIDVTAVDTNGLGHSYYGDNASCLCDLFDLLKNSMPPDKRPRLYPKEQNGLKYWCFRP